MSDVLTVNRTMSLREARIFRASPVKDEGIDLRRKPPQIMLPVGIFMTDKSITEEVFGPILLSEDDIAFGPILVERIFPGERELPSIKKIISAVARHYRVLQHDICSARRTANIVRPRQVAMYLAKTMTLRSLPDIGRRFGGRDHTTVLHGVRKIEFLLPTNTDLAEDVETIKAELLA